MLGFYCLTFLLLITQIAQRYLDHQLITVDIPSPFMINIHIKGVKIIKLLQDFWV